MTATDYFNLLGLKPAFAIDSAALESAYFAAQRQYHPDRFAARPAIERAAALQRSADINAAYHTLKDPLLRAYYLLKQQGIMVGSEQDTVKPSQALLMETLDWREQIEEASTPQALARSSQFLASMHTDALAAISLAYQEKIWDTMAHAALRLNYIIKAQAAVAARAKTMK